MSTSVINFADVVDAPETTVENSNTAVNDLLTSHGFTYYYSMINHEGEGIQRPGGNAPELDPNTHDYTKAISIFYSYAPSGYIEKTVNASGIFTVYYGSANPSKANWIGTISKNGIDIDTISGTSYRKVEINVVAGDTIRIYENSTSIIFIYAVIYPGT